LNLLARRHAEGPKDGEACSIVTLAGESEAVAGPARTAKDGAASILAQPKHVPSPPTLPRSCHKGSRRSFQQAPSGRAIVRGRNETVQRQVTEVFLDVLKTVPGRLPAASVVTP
jgi:hypothetical protein